MNPLQVIFNLVFPGLTHHRVPAMAGFSKGCYAALVCRGPKGTMCSRIDAFWAWPLKQR